MSHANTHKMCVIQYISIKWEESKEFVYDLFYTWFTNKIPFNYKHNYNQWKMIILYLSPHAIGKKGLLKCYVILNVILT